MTTPQVGRNDPCPCNSKKKYKKCCGRALSGDASAWAAGSGGSGRSRITTFDLTKLMATDQCPCRSGKTFGACHFPTMRRAREIGARIEAERRTQEERFGEVRPIVHVNFHGYKFVAVGSELHYAKESEVKTFPDFLMKYMPTKLGEAWGKAEIRKPLEERHSIMQWYDALCRQQRQFEKNSQGLLEFVPDGPSMAYMLLAYDLYVLRNHRALQARVIDRLKKPDQFQGARYELFATATCIRAGFEIHHENEADGSKTHAEFKAVHRHTGQKIALEAKSRHRPGVLGFRKDWPEEPNPKARVRGLVIAALEKDVDAPLVAFIDVNLPPAEPRLPEEPWFREVVDTVTAEFGDRTDESEPFNLLVFTNQPHHYGEPGSPTPGRSTLNFWSDRPRRPAAHPEAVLRISEEAAKWGLIPNEFPGYSLPRELVVDLTD